MTQENMDKRQTFWGRCFKDKNGAVLLGQKPNGPQIIGWVSLLVFWLASGRAEHIAGLIAYGTWFTWAWLEITEGVNYFRRTCGSVVLLILLLVAVLR